MLSVGKLFAVAAVLALAVGFVRWPQPQTGFYTITIKNRAYGLGSEYWVFSIAAIFAVLAAAYYWLPILISLDLGHSVSLLHFWLSATTYVLTVEDPHRFRKSRDAECFVGLQPGRRNSGESEPQMHITKGGRDEYLRTLLAQGQNSGDALARMCQWW